MNSYREWNGECQRCFKKSKMHTMSMFDVALICMGCSEAERAHPQYERAAKIEMEEVKKGNRNFVGIGRPSDLLPGMEWESYPEIPADEDDQFFAGNYSLQL